MDAKTFLTNIFEPARFEWSFAASDLSDLMLMAIAGQESGWSQRLQDGGPARGWWQFELAGVGGVMVDKVCGPRLEELCNQLAIPFVSNTIYEAIAWNDTLAYGLARLLLWSDPQILPARGQSQVAYQYYLRNWRPGAPDALRFAQNYATALTVLA